MTSASLSLDPERQTLDSADPSSLTRMTMRELDAVFAELPPARLGSLQGHKRGRLLAVSGADWIPAPARELLFGLVNELPVWRGASCEGEFGAHTWLLPQGQLGVTQVRLLAAFLPITL